MGMAMVSIMRIKSGIESDSANENENGNDNGPDHDDVDK